MKQLATQRGLIILTHPDMFGRGHIRSRRERYQFLAKSSGFTGWLMEQVGRTDPVGDVAADIQYDSLWPHDLDDIKLAIQLFDDYNTSEPARKALEQAWDEYLMHGGGSVSWTTDVSDWIGERCIRDGQTPAHDLHADYVEWCAEHNYVARPFGEWSKRCTAAGHASKKVMRESKIVVTKPLTLRG